jgi:NADH:ubiquinone oxidoreductase subunit E
VNRIDEIVDRYRGDKSALIQILLDIQREYYWLPKEALLRLSERLEIPLNRIQFDAQRATLGHGLHGHRLLCSWLASASG